jgi:small subunit ribosomal protein S25e
MGGKKKLSLKQIERTQDKKDEAAEKKKGGGKSGPAPERKAPGIMPPDLKSDKILGEIKKMKAVTPFVIASRFNVRLSVAKDMLDELAQRGVLEYISSGKNLKIYKPHD